MLEGPFWQPVWKVWGWGGAPSAASPFPEAPDAEVGGEQGGVWGAEGGEGAVPTAGGGRPAPALVHRLGEVLGAILPKGEGSGSPPGLPCGVLGVLIAANLGVTDGPPHVKDKLIREGEVAQPLIQRLGQFVWVPLVLAQLHHGGRQF